MAAEAGVTVEKEFGADLPLIRGDAVKLRQVFTNLIGNAHQVHPLRRQRHDSRRAARPTAARSIEIADTGIGMSEEEIKIALTPFGQVDGSRARWREGTGLGLPIAKSLIELHSGKLEHRQREGHRHRR